MSNVFYFLKKLYSFVGNTLIVNLLGMIIVSLLEGVGVLLLLPMMEAMNFINIGTQGTVFKNLFSFLHTFSPLEGLGFVLSTYIILVTGQALLQKEINLRNARMQIQFIHYLRMETYQLLLQANWAFYIKKRKSDLLNVLIADLGRVSGGTNMLLQFVTSLIFMLVQIIIAFFISARITIFVLICGILLAFLSQSFIKRSNQLGRRTSINSQAYLSGINDFFNGVKDIKANTLEASRYVWMKDWGTRVEREQLDLVRLRGNSQLLYKISAALLIVALIFLSIMFFQSQPAELLVIILIFSKLWPRFTSIQSNMEQIASNLHAFDTIISIQKECEVYRESIDLENTVIPMRANEHIVCEDVSFSYQKSNHTILQNIDLTIPVNTTVAIVGKSGAGKSTLVDIMMGLLQANSGRVLVDGQELTPAALPAFKKSISYVPQEPFLFNATIRENLQIVNQDICEEEIWETLRLVAASTFVSELPDRLETVVGDKGVRLSGGERQRLVLARAILKKPSVLILDEATSALDSQNEVSIQQALQYLSGKMTIIIIAHRFSTIRHADQVVVIEEGKIVQVGTFSQLSAMPSGTFKDLLEASIIEFDKQFI